MSEISILLLRLPQNGSGNRKSNVKYGHTYLSVLMKSFFFWKLPNYNRHSNEFLINNIAHTPCECEFNCLSSRQCVLVILKSDVIFEKIGAYLGEVLLCRKLLKNIFLAYDAFNNVPTYSPKVFPPTLDWFALVFVIVCF